MTGGFERRPGGSSLVQDGQPGGADASPGKRTLAEQVELRAAAGGAAADLDGEPSPSPFMDMDGDDVEGGDLREALALGSPPDHGASAGAPGAGHAAFLRDQGAQVSAAPAAPAPLNAGAGITGAGTAGAGTAGAGTAAPAKPKIAPVATTKSFNEYVVRPANPRAYDPLAGKKTVGGTDLAAVDTKKPEAKVLNALRQQDRRFNAAALIVAQQNLQVGNATGAFNTETLRKLRARASDPRLASTDPAVVVAAIVDDAVWKPFHTKPGAELFLPSAAADASEPANPRATHRADHVAQAMGYKDYESYRKKLKPFTFLGVQPSPGKDHAHPHLIARLEAAESFLKQKYGDGVTPDKFGWKGGLVGTYHTDAKKIDQGAAHFHTMGLAVDFDPSINGWLYPQSELKRQTVSGIGAKNKEIKDRNAAKKPDEALEDLLDASGIATEWVKQSTNIMDVAFTQAGYLFNAVVLTKAKMVEWSDTLSTEELHARISSAAAALKQYIDLAKSGKDKDIIDRFVAAGFTEAQAREALPEMRKFPERYNGGFSRSNTHGLPTTHSAELMVALRDAAGLTFGGSEMSHGDNGDFMHFDCRNDPLGQLALGAMG